MNTEKMMKKTAWFGLLIIMFLVVSCNNGGGSGTITGRVVDGFGNPLGGEAVRITLSEFPVVTSPDRWGKFTIIAPEGRHAMMISFTNLAAGFKFVVEDTVDISGGTLKLGDYVLESTANMEAWEAYNEGNVPGAIALFNAQATEARAGQAWLPYVHGASGNNEENTLLTQGVLAAENGLGWCYANGMQEIEEGRKHYMDALSNGYKNYDAMVGLAGIAIGEGNGADALDWLNAVIDVPGIYNSEQLHDDIHEVDLMAVKSLAEFMVGKDILSVATSDSIKGVVGEDGNAASAELLSALNALR